MKSETFEQDDVTFRYPTDWSIDFVNEENNWSAHVQSPGSAFVVVSMQQEAEDPAELVDATLIALREEYPELDAEDRVEKLAGQMALGHDIDMIALDTTINCRTRSLNTANGPLLMISQCSEPERSRYEDGIKLIFTSLQIEIE